MPITTEDCKKFLVEFQKANPNLEFIRFGFDDQRIAIINANDKFLLKDVLVEENWKRLYKKTVKKTDNEKHYAYISGDIKHHVEPTELIPTSKIKSVRGFDMITADGQIAYMVLELHDETLRLGNYIGD